METREAVGTTAGKIWHLLNDNGSLTLAQLKKKIGGSGDLIGFALGWLAREDKVDITLEKKSFKAALKQ